MALPNLTPSSAGGARRPSVEHLVLLAVLLAVVVGGALWFLTRSGSAPAAAQPPTKPAAVVPGALAHVAAKANPVTAQKAAFLKAGNKICATMNAQLKVLGEIPQDPAAAAAFIDKDTVISRRAMAKLTALHAPAADAAQLKVLFNEVTGLEKLARAASSDLRSGATANAIDAIAEGADASNQANADFIAYGLTVCGT